MLGSQHSEAGKTKYQYLSNAFFHNYIHTHFILLARKEFLELLYFDASTGGQTPVKHTSPTVS
jgi:hypothetical protein